MNTMPEVINLKDKIVSEFSEHLKLNYFFLRQDDISLGYLNKADNLPSRPKRINNTQEDFAFILERERLKKNVNNIPSSLTYLKTEIILNVKPV